MKNLFKLFGIIAFVAVIGFSFAACSDGGGGGGTSGSGTWGNPPAALVGTWLMMETSPVLVINADGTGSNAGDPVTSWKVKRSELKMTYSGVESVVKWNVSGNTLTLSYPDDTSLLGMGNLLIAYSPLTKQGGTNGNDPGPAGVVDALCNLRYNGNGADSGVPGVSNYKRGAVATVSNSAPTRAGYVFAGWNTERDRSGTPYTPGSTFTITENITLYAIWEEMGEW
jgi:uncharacterized repeat protein (TIGR02543 family)